MAVGENFKRINRSNLEQLKNDLQTAKVAFTEYAKNSDSNNWTWDELNRLEQKVISLEYELNCAIYEDNRKRNWR